MEKDTVCVLLNGGVCRIDEKILMNTKVFTGRAKLQMAVKSLLQGI